MITSNLPLKKRNHKPGNFLQKLTTNLACAASFAVAFATPLGLVSMSALVFDSAYAQDSGQNPSPSKNEANLNFVGADIESVIKAIGHYTGTTFIIDPRVKGTINLVTEKPVTKEQAFSLLTSTLRLQGYAVVRTDGYTKVLPESDGKLQAGPTQAIGIKGDQIATQVFHLNYESAASLVTVLRPLISPNNTISADQGNNSVVITDYADNLKRLGKIIATLDTPGSSEVDLIPLKHAIASDIAPLLVKLTEQQSVGPGDTSKTVVLAEMRTNAIILHAPSEARANQIKKFIAKLDRPTALPGNVHVVYLRNADAVKLAQTLRAIAVPDSSSGGTTTPSSSGLSSPQGLGQNRPSSSGSSFGGQGGGTGGSAFGGGGGGLGGGMGGGGLGGGGSYSSSGGSTQASLPSGGPAGFIQADQATNTLIITASEAVYRNLRSVIDQLDARRAQVYIEAMIVDVSTTDIEQFGVQWAGITGSDSSGTRVGAAQAFNTVDGNNLFKLRAARGAAIPAAGFNLGVLSTKIGLGAIASALESTGIANVLSVPTLTTLDNEEARVLVGQNVPFVTGSYANTSAGTPTGGATVNPFQTVERKDVGVILKVRPQISEGGAVKLSISQEVSDVDSTTAANQNGPTTNSRSIDTTVIVDDGEILVLGGLMSDNVSKQDDRVPILGDIPYIGNLFKYRTKKGVKRNLLVFLRPTVLRNTDQSNAISLNRYDYIRGAARAGVPGEELLAVPPLEPEYNGMLIPQPILNRESTTNKLNVPGEEKTQPLSTEKSGAVTPPNPVTTPATSAPPAS